MKTIHQILLEAVKILKENNIETPRLDAEVILAHLLGWNRLDLITKSQEELGTEIIEVFFNRIHQRAKGLPVQYITGRQEFMGLNFRVTPDVLIPRPDTEILVETAIKEAGAMSKPLTIVDIGTGSGAISLSLAHFIEDAHIHSIDISSKALAVAKDNAQELSLEAKVTFYQGDLLSPIENQLEGQVDLLVSNPPYIPTADILTLQREVQHHEPRLALDGGEEGLDYYRRIIHEGEKFLSTQGRMIFEVGHDQAGRVAELLKCQRIYGDVIIVKDLSGIERVVLAKIKGSGHH